MLDNISTDDLLVKLKPNQCIVDRDKLDLTVSCLNAFKDTFSMLQKLPMKKSMKLQGIKLSNCLDELIVYLNSVK